MHLYLISLKRAKHTCTDNCKSQWVPPTRFHHPCPSCLSVTIHQVPPGFLTQQRFSPTKLDMCEPKLDKCEPRLDMCEPRWPTIFHCRDRCHHDATTFCRNMRQGQITWWHVEALWGGWMVDSWSLSGEASVVMICPLTPPVTQLFDTPLLPFCLPIGWCYSRG
jgi:hypothetical protein